MKIQAIFSIVTIPCAMVHAVPIFSEREEDLSVKLIFRLGGGAKYWYESFFVDGVLYAIEEPWAGNIIDSIAFGDGPAIRC
ncbi:hypothetical protein BJ875DRAFT_481114 [Amylocarpus encephaloides]|uniref:Uncharacterized protein n=1 Tax=Amylocarpus encephaloides TaxID=45428 RepID=A0A9P7YQ17_9HELO|nr:hypothetical protein BJ875DRAFT_481114 [Amylocarpus encephaloides]